MTDDDGSSDIMEGIDDMEWDESKAVHVSVSKLGEYKNERQLRAFAKKYADQFVAGQKITIGSTGNTVLISQESVDHSFHIAKRHTDTFLSITELPELLKKATKLAEGKDKHGRSFVRAMEIYQTPVEIRGKKYIAEMVILHGIAEHPVLGTARVLRHQKLKD